MAIPTSISTCRSTHSSGLSLSRETVSVSYTHLNVSYLKKEISAIENGIETNDPYLTSFLKYRNIRSLNRGILVELVTVSYTHLSMGQLSKMIVAEAFTYTIIGGVVGTCLLYTSRCV